MLTASAAYRAAAANGTPPLLRATATLADSTVLSIGGERLAQGGTTISEATSSESSLDLGAFVASQATLTVVNADGWLDPYDLGDADLSLFVGYDVGGEVEWVRRGRYVVERPDTLGVVSTLRCEGWAHAALTDHAMPQMQFPTTLGAIASACCAESGVTLASAGFEGADTVVAYAPEGEPTCADALRMVARVAGVFVRETPEGGVELLWYDDAQAPFEAAHNSTSEVGTADVMVTGVRVKSMPAPIGEDGEEPQGAVEALGGSEGYVLNLGELQMVAPDDAQAVADAIASRVMCMVVRPFRAQTVGTPLLQAGDRVRVTDVRGAEHLSWATQVTWSAGRLESVSCGAESPRRNAASTVPLATRVEQAAREAGRSSDAAASARGAAAQAMQVAQAIGQHFWTDEDGVHITEATQDAWAESPTGFNQLSNALGILLRNALTNLLSITPDAVAFYDGEGNLTDNVIASLGSTTTLGKASGFHLMADARELSFWEGNVRVAYIDGEQLVIPRAAILDQLRVGIDGTACWEWAMEDDGSSMSFGWVG